MVQQKSVSKKCLIQDDIALQKYVCPCVPFRPIPSRLPLPCHKEVTEPEIVSEKFSDTRVTKLYTETLCACPQTIEHFSILHYGSY